jgi:protein-tyrosine phosphatase
MVDAFSDLGFGYGAPRTQILPGIFLGDEGDAMTFDGPWIAVHEQSKIYIRPNTHWIPIMVGDEGKYPDGYRASREALDAATSMIRHYQKLGKPVIVTCQMGIERGPLVMAYFLVRYEYFKNMNDAYANIKMLRPQIMPRLHWMPRKA